MTTFASCLGCMALVAWISYVKSRGQAQTRDGYFLAGRSLTGVFIAGSLLLTNLSAEQLIGLNGSAYAFNLSSMAWEVTAVFAMVIMATVLLPRYLQGGFTTLPEFLGQRFDDRVRRLSVVLFVLGYGLVTIPSVLYSGALAMLQLFDLSGLLGVDRASALLITILLIGSVGGIYAIAGGLRAVAVSDTLNGIGLLIIGVLVPVLGLIKLGDGSLTAGIDQLTGEHTHKLNAIGTETDPTPFATLFTGMILANLFYWGTNQYVIQRTLGARSLAEGQKGVLLSGFFKILIPFFMMVPGVIAYHLYGAELESMDRAYPRLVADVLPAALSGFFLAVLLGAVFSSFNSLLNSAATLICIDLVAPLYKKPPDDQRLIRMARAVGIGIALLAFAIAPLLQFAPEGLWQVVRKFTGFYNIPIIAIVVAAFCMPKANAVGAISAVLFHLPVYAVVTFVWTPGLHFVHVYAILFAAELGIIQATSLAHARKGRTTTTFPPRNRVGREQPATPAPETEWPALQSDPPAPVEAIDMQPWRWTRPICILLTLAVLAVYWLFSPAGIAA